MTTYRTARETEAVMIEGGSCVVPAGTPVIPIESGQRICFAVESVDLIVKLTGNTHDPRFRYAYVKAADVEVF